MCGFGLGKKKVDAQLPIQNQALQCAIQDDAIKTQAAQCVDWLGEQKKKMSSQQAGEMLARA